MPHVEITLVKGRSVEQKRKAAERITQVIVEDIGAIASIVAQVRVGDTWRRRHEVRPRLEFLREHAVEHDVGNPLGLLRDFVCRLAKLVGETLAVAPSRLGVRKPPNNSADCCLDRRPGSGYRKCDNPFLAW